LQWCLGDIKTRDNYLLNCCSQLIHLLAKFKILGNDEKEAAMLLSKIEDQEVYKIAGDLEPHVDYAMARNWADKCWGNSMIYYLIFYKKF
jgi:hypothetical protein